MEDGGVGSATLWDWEGVMSVRGRKGRSGLT